MGDVNTRKDGPVLDCAQGPTEAALSNMLAIGGGCFWGIEHYMTRSKCLCKTGDSSAILPIIELPLILLVKTFKIVFLPQF